MLKLEYQNTLPPTKRKKKRFFLAAFSQLSPFHPFVQLSYLQQCRHPSRNPS